MRPALPPSTAPLTDRLSNPDAHILHRSFGHCLESRYWHGLPTRVDMKPYRQQP